MKKIASPEELQTELRTLLAYSESPNPSRGRVAGALRGLADRVAWGTNGVIIPSRRWKHKATGATASLYGAVPWSGAPGDRKEDWVLEDVGYTIQWEDGTIGVGRPPFNSKAEAESWLERDKARRQR